MGMSTIERKTQRERKRKIVNIRRISYSLHNSPCFFREPFQTKNMSDLGQNKKPMSFRTRAFVFYLLIVIS